MRHTTVGLINRNTDKATPGFTIVSPMFATGVYLIDMDGEVVHQWDTDLVPGKYAYLLDNGNLLWSGQTNLGPKPAGGKGGIIRELSWEGEVLWEYIDHSQHHDFRRLRNGNTLYIGWEEIPKAKASIVRGGVTDSEDERSVIWGDFLKEVDPTGKVVWEWHIHSDLKIENYPLHIMSQRNEFAHCNSCSELPDGNILLSFRRISTLLIIDKVTKQVKWHHRDDNWGQQHDAEMLKNGNILFFANGIHVPQGVLYSRVIEINPETQEEAWFYEDTPNWNFFSPNISGCQRLDSGNTLICEGLTGRIFEVTRDREVVWEYINPWYGGEQSRGDSNAVFRSYRYSADSPQIRSRLV